MTARGLELSQERREAAECYRNLYLTWGSRRHDTFADASWRCINGGGTGTGHPGVPELALRLARLIDAMCCYGPPDEDGYTVCSECGCEVEAETASWWSFCPECGRRIIREANDNSWEGWDDE